MCNIEIMFCQWRQLGRILIRNATTRECDDKCWLLLVVWVNGIRMCYFSRKSSKNRIKLWITLLNDFFFFHFLLFYWNSYIEQDRVCGFWTWLFVLSKLPELGDTIFIVLRKQPLIFLHWYHHITVLIYSWFSYTEYTSSARWFIVMNYCVHSVMYSYYALRAMGYKPPRFIPMIITSMQLTQMIVGCTINLWAYDYLKAVNPSACHISPINVKLSIAMYFSYFVLFARFFYVTYLSPNARKGKRPTTTFKTQHDQQPQLDGKTTRANISNTNSINNKLKNQ